MKKSKNIRKKMKKYNDNEKMKRLRNEKKNK